jgi:hypothetical protein
MAEQNMHAEDTGVASGAATGGTGAPEPGASSASAGAGSGSGNYSTTPGVGDFGALPGPADFGTAPGPEDYGTAPGGGRINLGLPNGGGGGASIPRTDERAGKRAAGDGGVNAAAGTDATDGQSPAGAPTGNYGSIPYGSGASAPSGEAPA